MDLMLWFDDFKENSMYRAWNHLADTGYFEGYETMHRHQLYRRPWRYAYQCVKTRDWIWLFTGPPYEASILPISTASFLKENTIFFASTPFWDNPQSLSRIGIAKAAWKYYLENSEVVMATEASQEALENSLGIESRVIPHAVNTDTFHPIENVERRHDTVLFVGRMVKKKGVTELLSISKQNPDIKFWFCGTGELSGVVKTTANERDNVRYFGYVDSERELAEIYSQASLLVLPSIRTGGDNKWEEFFGRVIIEAFACGTPVVASNHAGPKSIITKDTGITVPQLEQDGINQSKLERILRSLLSNREGREAMGTAARERAKRSFDTKVVAEEWLKVFRRLE